MFICPSCNREVADPAFVRARPWWRRRRWESRRPMPVCDAGHKLRTFLGDLTEVSLTGALWRGLLIGGLLVMLGMMEDLRVAHVRSAGIMVSTAGGLFLSARGFVQAWTWAGSGGPVQRLSSRACGMALGMGIWTVVMFHAIYFHWVGLMEAGLARGVEGLAVSIAALWVR